MTVCAEASDQLATIKTSSVKRNISAAAGSQVGDPSRVMYAMILFLRARRVGRL